MRRGGRVLARTPEEVPSSSSSRDNDEVPILNQRKLSLRRFAGPGVNVENKAQSTATPIPQDQDAKIEMTPEALQMALNERKAEFKRNAEEKRLDGLKQILNRKSRTGINPLEQFPKEIWTLLLEELRPEERLSMREVHPLFCDLTEDHLIRDILFPLSINVNSMLPDNHINTGNPVLNLRSVSKSLRKSADKGIESRILEAMRQAQERMFWRLPRYIFAVTTDINWINRLLVFSRGPENQRPKLFVRRALQIELQPEYWRSWSSKRLQPPPEEDRREMLQRYFMMLRNNVIEMLEAIGDQVMLFILTCFAIKKMEVLGLNISQIYSFLRECLLLMPNVKWLRLNALGLERLHRQPNWKSIASLALQEHPMPTLAKLERVDLRMQSSLRWYHASQAFPIWDCVLAANPQVKYFTYYDDVYRDRYDQYAKPAVMSLALENVCLGHQERMLDLKLLRRISECKWNLKQLELQVTAQDDDDGLGLNTILLFLNKFPAMEDLSLSIQIINFVGGMMSHLLLPNLKKLKLNIGPTVKLSKDDECVTFFFSLQFLFQCVQIRELVWNNLINDSSKLRRLLMPHGNMVDFQGGVVDLRGSNVWDAFPALRRIAVKFRARNCVRKMEYYTPIYRNRKLVYEDNREWNEGRLVNT